MSELINSLEIFDDISNDLKKVIKLFYVCENEKGYNVLFVTLNDKVFGFGSNDWGVCGIGHQIVVKEPQIIEELCDKSVIQFYNGFSFALALTSDNKLFGWGSNECGQLGVNDINHSEIYKPFMIEDLNDITIEKISCGAGHVLVLSNDAIVYGWGDNSGGQVGCGIELGNNISVITQLKTLKKIKTIHCSFFSSFALTDNGMVYSWGRNTFCGLGYDFGNDLQQEECVFEPKLIENLSKITSICSSFTNTYFLSSDRNVYYCGLNDINANTCHQLIPDCFITIINKPSIQSLHSRLYFKSLNERFNDNYYKTIATLLIGDTIYEINANSIAKTNYKSFAEFYSKKYNITHQTINLNNEAINQIESIIKEYIENKASISIDLLKKFDICKNLDNNEYSIKYIHIFNENIGFNALFVTNEDKVFGFGSNERGVCGLGHNENVEDPQIIDQLCYKGIQQFYNGFDLVLGITSDKDLYGWGFNEYGQLARPLLNKDFWKPNKIKLNNKVIQEISCGSHHSLMLTTDGMVYGWGLNKYGQIGCGKEFGDKISVITQLKTLTKFKAIHCSFLSSFALTDNGMVYSWGQSMCGQLGHELEENECVFEPKLIINVSNITSICSSGGNTYFLTTEGNIYYCGVYYGKNNERCYQKSSKLIESKHLNINSLFSVNCYQKSHPTGCALSEKCVYSLILNEIRETKYGNIEEFFANECQLTYKTYL